MVLQTIQDTIKTRIQAGSHKSVIRCSKDLWNSEGVAGFWKGFSAYLGRQAPHTILTLIFVERLNSLLALLTKRR